MRRLATLALALVLALLPHCAFRTPGLEVALRIEPAPSSPPSSLHIERIELLRCPDFSRAVRWEMPRVASVAHAHELPGVGPFALRLPTTAHDTTFAETPGIYCDLRVHFGDPTHAALTQGDEIATPFERAIVLRLVDDRGEPTELALDAPPDRAEIRLALGAFAASDSPTAALSHVIAGARAELTAR